MCVCTHLRHLVLRCPDCCALISYWHHWDFFFQPVSFLLPPCKERFKLSNILSLFLNPCPDEKLETLNHWLGDKRSLRHSPPALSYHWLFSKLFHMYTLSVECICTQLQFLYIYSLRNYIQPTALVYLCIYELHTYALALICYKMYKID